MRRKGYSNMEYTFNFQLKGGDPCKVTVEAESYDAAFQKLCALPGQFHIWRDRGYIELIPYPEDPDEKEKLRGDSALEDYIKAYDRYVCDNVCIIR
jgi:hypothetical protein